MRSISSFTVDISILLCQSYEIKFPPWTILWFRILGIFSVENIKRLCVFMFQTWDNSQLLRRVLWISAELTIVSSLKHKNTQPLYILNRVRVLHLDRLKEGTWLHSFAQLRSLVSVYSLYLGTSYDFHFDKSVTTASSFDLGTQMAARQDTNCQMKAFIIKCITINIKSSSF